MRPENYIFFKKNLYLYFKIKKPLIQTPHKLGHPVIVRRREADPKSVQSSSAWPAFTFLTLVKIQLSQIVLHLHVDTNVSPRDLLHYILYLLHCILMAVVFSSMQIRSCESFTYFPNDMWYEKFCASWNFFVLPNILTQIHSHTRRSLVKGWRFRRWKFMWHIGWLKAHRSKCNGPFLLHFAADLWVRLGMSGRVLKTVRHIRSMHPLSPPLLCWITLMGQRESVCVYW